VAGIVLALVKTILREIEWGEGVGIRLRGYMARGRSGVWPPQIELQLEHGDVWCVTKRNLVAVIP
jgi:hypothetical protein